MADLKKGDHCPKCGLGAITSGPKYVGIPHTNDGGIDECLNWACTRCGYTISLPCADAKKPESTDPPRPVEAFENVRNKFFGELK